MPSYYVSWDIQVDADSPEDAALQALDTHRDPESTATVFLVTDEDTNATVLIDTYEIVEQ